VYKILNQNKKKKKIDHFHEYLVSKLCIRFQNCK